MSIDAKAFVTAVRERVAASPEKVYVLPKVLNPVTEELEPAEACWYVETDHEKAVEVPSCLIGCALYDIGVPLEDMKKFNDSSIRGLNNHLNLGLPDPVVYWAADVQSGQDSSDPWNQALEQADEYSTLPAEYQEVA